MPYFKIMCPTHFSDICPSSTPSTKISSSEPAKKEANRVTLHHSGGKRPGRRQTCGLLYWAVPSFGGDSREANERRSIRVSELDHCCGHHWNCCGHQDVRHHSQLGQVFVSWSLRPRHTKEGQSGQKTSFAGGFFHRSISWGWNGGI